MSGFLFIILPFILVFLLIIESDDSELKKQYRIRKKGEMFFAEERDILIWHRVQMYDFIESPYGSYIAIAKQTGCKTYDEAKAILDKYYDFKRTYTCKGLECITFEDKEICVDSRFITRKKSKIMVQCWDKDYSKFVEKVSELAKSSTIYFDKHMREDFD